AAVGFPQALLGVRGAPEDRDLAGAEHDVAQHRNVPQGVLRQEARDAPRPVHGDRVVDRVQVRHVVHHQQRRSGRRDVAHPRNPGAPQRTGDRVERGPGQTEPQLPGAVHRLTGLLPLSSKTPGFRHDNSFSLGGRQPNYLLAVREVLTARPVPEFRLPRPARPTAAEERARWRGARRFIPTGPGQTAARGEVEAAQRHQGRGPGARRAGHGSGAGHGDRRPPGPRGPRSHRGDLRSGLGGRARFDRDRRAGGPPGARVERRAAVRRRTIAGNRSSPGPDRGLAGRSARVAHRRAGAGAAGCRGRAGVLPRPARHRHHAAAGGHRAAAGPPFRAGFGPRAHRFGRQGAARSVGIPALRRGHRRGLGRGPRPGRGPAHRRGAGRKMTSTTFTGRNGREMGDNGGVSTDSSDPSTGHRRRRPSARRSPKPAPRPSNRAATGSVQLSGARVPSAPPAVTRAAASNDLPEDRYLNRELSWLDFNARVLAVAEDRSQPLLERAKFLAIFSSNLDEFYMVRVAGLKRREETGLSVRSEDGLTPHQQLVRIPARNQDLMEKLSRIFLDELVPELEEQGIRIVSWADLDAADQRKLTDYFQDQIFPVLTPLAVDPAHPFPYISGLSLNLAVTV